MKRCLSLFLAAFALLLTLTALPVLAADDPSIQGDLRQNIQESMRDFIDRQLIDGKFYVYDPLTDDVLALQKPNLHDGIVKKGSFYISCADFIDAGGHSVDLDFMVADQGGAMRTLQAIVHKIDGKKRPYDLENEKR